MASALFWCLLVVGAGVSMAAPDFYSAWCPCKLAEECPVPYGSFFDDIALFGEVPPCKKFSFVRCCSSSNIPEGFNLERRPEYLPRPVAGPALTDLQRSRLLSAAVSDLDLQDVEKRQDVIDFKAAQEKLKRDIANGIDNPNPPCGCYSEGTCPGRYATKSTGRDINCLPRFETCCFLDDPWPNFKVTNLTINAPCSIEEACSRFFGTSPFDISSFGPLEPCYLGQNRCLDYLGDGSNKQPTVLKPPTTTPRPTTRPPTTTYRTMTPRPAYSTTTRRTTTTYRTTTERATTTPYFTTTGRRPDPEPTPGGGGSNSIIDIVTNGAYLPPSFDFGNAADRAEPAGQVFDLPF